MKRRVINLTLEELVTKVKSLEEQVINLAARQSNRSADADSGISEAKAKTEEVNTDLSALDDDIADSLLALAESISDMSMLIEEVSLNESDV